ncbi:MAG: tRNA-specific 2-thiouridylase [Desulfurella sp.]|jgi:tRNA-specific 2-thiouridylase|uniref:tRNA-specific 2-thiouridylase n=1 Tax=Desulfurella TaxID=33001 RepID=UPI000CB847DA|nr:tRNA-specific 2-thiouridylase [Desulfurella multipotens]PMP62624.1 MAG: hypothetical protein C0192_09010 [Desulfurella multipotens]
MKSVLIGVSGGIDSTFSAIYLSEKGYNVIAINLVLTSKNTVSKEVIELFKKYDIDFYTLDIRDYFKKTVIDSFINDYKKGFTPNPCSICNPLVKFKILIEQADKYNTDYIATGHYANTQDGFIKKHFSNKDQSYFLAYLPKKTVERTIFPLKEFEKKDIKTKIPLNLQESSDLCFVNDYRNLINHTKSGYILHNSQIVGLHNGFHNYTVGQRKGIKFSNEPYYVKSIDAVNGNIEIAKRHELYSDKFTINQIHLLKSKEWFNHNKVECLIRFKAKSTLAKFEPDTRKVFLDEALFAITKGQIAVFYHNDLIVGCGRIDEV